VQIVPFNGTPALVAALLGGSVDAGVEILGPVKAQIAAQKLRALAVMGSKRRADMPDVPTVMESGIADFDVASWNALAAPARTPPDVIARLNRDINAALASPEVRAKLAELGVEARGGSPPCIAISAFRARCWSRRAPTERTIARCWTPSHAIRTTGEAWRWSMRRSPTRSCRSSATQACAACATTSCVISAARPITPSS